MGRLPTNKRNYEIAKVQERHREICRQVVLGRTNKQIATQIGISPQMVSYTRNSRIAQDVMEDLGEERDKDVKEISVRIAEMAPKAADLIEASLSGSLEGREVPMIQRLKDAHSILDRAGYKPVTKVDSTHTSLHLTGEDVIKIKQRAAQMIEESKNLVDIEEAEVIDIGVKGNGNSDGNSGEEHSGSGGADSGNGSIEEGVDEGNDYLRREISRIDQD